jgi:hypothetical protein
VLEAAWTVLRGQATWIGYGGAAQGLPKLRPGILPTWERIPDYEPARQIADTLDRQYALGYVSGKDLTLLWKNIPALRKNFF